MDYLGLNFSSRVGEECVEKMRISELIEPSRTPWANFPAVIHASESAVKPHLA